jgi:prevent-host-death family protein
MAPAPEMAGSPVGTSTRWGLQVALDWHRSDDAQSVSGLQYSSECHYIVETTMNQAVSATDANRRFSELLRTVKKGRSVVVTSHGKPVARISPVIEDDRIAAAGRVTSFTTTPHEDRVRH